MKLSLLTMALTIAVAGTAFAGPKDKNANTLVNPDSLVGTAPWDNTVVDAGNKYTSCKQQFKVKADTALGLYNQDLVCILTGDTYTSLGVAGGNSVVIKFSIDEKGKASSKADLRSIGCGILASATSFNATTKCWIDDPSWNFPFECSQANGIWISPNSQAGTEKYKPGDLAGLCQNFFMGFELEPPGSPAVLAETGTHSPCKKC